MTTVSVNPGNCKYTVLIKAEKVEGGKLNISLSTECKMVLKMLDDISLLDMRTIFTNHINNPVYRSASKHLKHAACPVPCAILKAAEVELGLCLADDIKIEFKS